ncbi:peptidoglycan DD-metalloendopeptidase family protein [Aquipuribacter hungaricus]|uniref:Peptidoglycan DD-metalloendopeptidase family protein n=1 Tax=Aquipuribacter hungaricus TaxID=545624 RepID=A0ABV7WHW5_9MICO
MVMVKVTVATVAASLLAGPLLVALLLATVTAPAVGAHLATLACTGPGSTPAGAGAAGAGAGEWRVPFEQAYTVSNRGFGRQFHPIHREWRPHTGQDLVSRPGPGPVVAASAGLISRAGDGGAYGNVVDIDHGGGISTRYAHLASIDPAVSAGAQVSTGQRLGVEGSTGTSTGNHLHFEVLRHGTAVDPVAFMAQRGAPLDGTAVPPRASAPDDVPPAGTVLTGSLLAGTATQPDASGEAGEGGVGFELPPAGQPRKASVINAPVPVPADVEALYRAAAERYAIPWTVLAGIGMAETAHGRLTATSSAGARGLMQFMPATWTTMGVDGDGDGRADITNDADSVHSAAHYLTVSGLTEGPDGVRAALFAYNRADWYVNDVLAYAHAYGGGNVLGDLTDCGPGTTSTAAGGNPLLPPIDDARVVTMLTWAHAQDGEPYVFGANGPDSWDCSSFTQTALAQIGISAPRTAAAQRDWLAAGNGYRVQLGQERPGDLVFWDSYLGPDRIGHVMLVADPATFSTIEARDRRDGTGTFSYADGPERNRFEIWRVGNLSDGATLSRT